MWRAIPSSWARRSIALAVGAVADQAERRVDAALAQVAERERARPSTRLIAVMRPIQPTTNALGRDAEQRPQLGAALVAARDAAVEVDPEPDHA